MKRTVLLTGATGYVGGRLLQRLEREDVRVRCLTRRRAAVERRAVPSSECQPWSPCATRVIRMMMYASPSRRRNQLTPRASSSYAHTVIARYDAAVA